MMIMTVPARSRWQRTNRSPSMHMLRRIPCIDPMEGMHEQFLVACTNWTDLQHILITQGLKVPPQRAQPLLWCCPETRRPLWQPHNTDTCDRSKTRAFITQSRIQSQSAAPWRKTINCSNFNYQTLAPKLDGLLHSVRPLNYTWKRLEWGDWRGNTVE